MKTIKLETILHSFIFAPIIFTLIISQVSSKAKASSSSNRPALENAPLFARWLVNQGSWGVLNTLDSSRAPFGNVMSYSDGNTGTPYFYLSILDPTTQYGLINSRSSFTLSEIELGSCNGKDPQSPLCAKITLSGRLRSLGQNSREGILARDALFDKHPQFATGFPQQNGTFSVFKLEIKNIFLVNMAAPPRRLTVDEYYLANS